jgi:glutathione S-transferase
VTAHLYVVDWAPYQYLVRALQRIKPMPGLNIRAFSQMNHPIAQEESITTPFVAFEDENGEAVFTFMAVAEALDRRFPEVKLCGESALLRGVVRSASQIIDEGFTMMTGSRLKDLPDYDGPMWHESSPAPAAFLETYVKKMAIIERLARSERFLLGERPYLPDVFLAASCWFAEDIGLPPVPHGNPQLIRWHERNCVTGILAR